jgi:hypothetical protein
MEYRVYLLDDSRHIHAAEWFSATEDDDAVLIAQSVHNACCDLFATFEVWRGTEIVAEGDGKREEPALDLRQIVQAHQENVLKLEDRLQRSFDCIDKSRKMLATTEALRAALRP